MMKKSQKKAFQAPFQAAKQEDVLSEDKSAQKSVEQKKNGSSDQVKSAPVKERKPKVAKKKMMTTNSMEDRPLSNPLPTKEIKPKSSKKKANTESMETAHASGLQNSSVKDKLIVEQKAQPVVQKMTRCLTEEEYDDIFSSVIASVLDYDSVESQPENKDTDSETEKDVEPEEEVALPEPYEAHSPQEAAEQPEDDENNFFMDAQKLNETSPTPFSSESVTLPELKHKKIGSFNKKMDKSFGKVKKLKISKTSDHSTSKPLPQLKPKPLVCNSKPAEPGCSKKTSKPKVPSFQPSTQEAKKEKTSKPKPSFSQSSSQDTKKSSSKSISSTQKSRTRDEDKSPDCDANPKKFLLWLQKKRNVGLWVQCCKEDCKKWRYLKDVIDPTHVPNIWYCSMNSDKRHDSCLKPEVGPSALEEEDLIHNKYTAGSLVWARLDGFPWWPAMVDDDPDIMAYYWLNGFSDIPTHYSVTFFDEEPVSRAWMTPCAMMPFTGSDIPKKMKKCVVQGADYTQRLVVAKDQAMEALQMSLPNRLNKYSFVARFKGHIGKKNVAQKHITGNKSQSDELDLEREISEGLLGSPDIVTEAEDVLQELGNITSDLDDNEFERKKSVKRKKKSQIGSIGAQNNDMPIKESTKKKKKKDVNSSGVSTVAVKKPRFDPTIFTAEMSEDIENETAKNDAFDRLKETQCVKSIDSEDKKVVEESLDVSGPEIQKYEMKSDGIEKMKTDHEGEDSDNKQNDDSSNESDDETQLDDDKMKSDAVKEPPVENDTDLFDNSDVNDTMQNDERSEETSRGQSCINQQNDLNVSPTDDTAYMSQGSAPGSSPAFDPEE